MSNKKIKELEEMVEYLNEKRDIHIDWLTKIDKKISERTAIFIVSMIGILILFLAISNIIGDPSIFTSYEETCLTSHTEEKINPDWARACCIGFDENLKIPYQLSIISDDAGKGVFVLEMDKEIRPVLCFDGNNASAYKEIGGIDVANCNLYGGEQFIEKEVCDKYVLTRGG